MRLAAVLIGAILASVAVDAQAEQGVPSQTVLSEMGLAGMQVMSDDEAMAIRGSGFSWGVGSAYHYRQSIYKFHRWVYKFQKHTKRFHNSIWKKHDGFKDHHSKHGKTPQHRPMKQPMRTW